MSVSRRAFPQLVGRIVEVFAPHGPAVDGLAERHAVDAVDPGVDKAVVGQNFHYRDDSARAVDILNMVMGIGGDLAQHRGMARQGVNVVHCEIHPGLGGDGEKVQHGVGRASHCDVESHGVEHRLPSGDIAWQDAFVTINIIIEGVFDYLCRGALEQLFAVDVGGNDCAVSRQREADSLVERVHGVGGEHSRA